MTNIRSCTPSPFRWFALIPVVSLLVPSFTDAVGSLPVAPAHPFSIRGTLPWHNFLCGPSAWNEEDYRKCLDNLKAQ